MDWRDVHQVYMSTYIQSSMYMVHYSSNYVHIWWEGSETEKEAKRGKDENTQSNTVCGFDVHAYTQEALFGESEEIE